MNMQYNSVNNPEPTQLDRLLSLKYQYMLMDCTPE